MSDATRAFRAAVWEALGRPVEADAEGMLDAGLSVATTAWGGLGVDPAYFGRHLGQRLDRGHPVSQQLPRLSFDDLYLAAACASGDSRAIAALEQRYATEIRSALSRVRHKFLQPEDFRQILRRKLFVGTETRPASIAQYAGQGALGVWIRVTALRTALNAARDERDADTPIDDEDLFDFEPSDDDPELIVHVPFTSDVKVRGVMVIGGGSGSAPSKLKCWVNKAPGEIDFSNADRKTPTQQWDLAEDFAGELEYRTDFTQFQAVSSLTLYFPTNFNGDGATEVWFVGLRGEGTLNRRDMIVTAVYEARAMPQDHKTPDEENVPCMPAV